jgi:hypothetical protein
VGRLPLILVFTLCVTWIAALLGAADASAIPCTFCSVLSSPASGAVVTSPVALSATYYDDNGGTGFQTYQVCTTSACSTVLWTTDVYGLSSMNVGSATFTGATGTYYWRVETFEDFPGSRSHVTAARSFVIGSAPSPPNAPAALAQYRSDGVTALPAAGWTNETSVVFRFTASDPDASQTLTPWVELSTTGTFAGTCGTAGSNLYSGTPVSAPTGGASVALRVDASALADSSTYYWRTCVVDQSGAASGWSTAAGSPPFRVDATAPVSPAAASIYDLSVSFSGDQDFTSDPNALSGSWAAGSDSGSGIASYSWCFSTSNSGCSAIAGTAQTNGDVSRQASATATGLAPATAYYLCVQARDVAGNVEASWSCSDGFRLAPSVTSTNPSSLPQGRSAVIVQVLGSGFQTGATISVSGTGITVGSAVFVNAGRIDVTLTVAGAAPLGARDVGVLNPDGGSGVGVGALTIAAPSISISLSTLDYDDAVRDTASPYTFTFGLCTPGVPRQVGPAGSGQATAGAAFVVTRTSDTNSVLQASVSDFTGPAPLAAGAVAWRINGQVGAWTSFTTANSTVDGVADPGTIVGSYDAQLTVPANQASGTYSSTLVWTALPLP